MQDVALITDETEDAETAAEPMLASAARKTRGSRGPCGIRLLVGIRILVGRMLVASLDLQISDSTLNATTKRKALTLQLRGRLGQRQQQKCRAFGVMSTYQMPSSQLQRAF